MRYFLKQLSADHARCPSASYAAAIVVRVSLRENIILRFSKNSPSFSFTQGFLLGQLSIVLLIGAFIKFFIFGDPPSPSETAAARAFARAKHSASPNYSHSRSLSFNSSPTNTPRKLRNKRSASHVLRPPPRLTTASILSKTYYNVNSHAPESLDWFNVLIAQTIAHFRTDAHDDDAILTSLTSILNGAQKPDFLSDIRVTEISLGEEFPILSNCRIHPVKHTDDDPAASDGPRLQARMDVDLSDFITLGVETKIILNYPKPFTAVLPVALAVSVVRFSGTLSISFLPSHPHTQQPDPPSANGAAPAPQQPPSTHPTTLAFSFLPDYRLDLSIRSLVGSRSRLQDISKVAQLVENRLHQWIDERCVEPRVQQVVLPSLWPRKKNTRGPSSDGTGAEGSNIGTASGAVLGGGDWESSGGGKETFRERDMREEARREFEEERVKDGSNDGLGGTSNAFEEGLRMRRREYDMPGAMPGMMIN